MINVCVQVLSMLSQQVEHSQRQHSPPLGNPNTRGSWNLASKASLPLDFRHTTTSTSLWC